MRARFGEPLSVQLEPGEVQIHALAFDVVMSNVECVGPGNQRVFRARGFDSIIGLSDIRGQREIGRVEFDRFGIKLQRLIEDLLLCDSVKLPCILAKEVNRRAKVVIIDRLKRA